MVRRTWTARLVYFFFNDTATTEIYTLSLHDALPISSRIASADGRSCCSAWSGQSYRSEEHTSELQSRVDLVCRLLLEKKKKELKHAARSLTFRTVRTLSCSLTMS